MRHTKFSRRQIVTAGAQVCFDLSVQAAALPALALVLWLLWLPAAGWVFSFRQAGCS